jgi:hypothetical protein
MHLTQHKRPGCGWLKTPTRCNSPRSWADGWRPRPAANACASCARPNPAPDLTTMTTETIADPSVGPEQRAIDADTARILRNLVAELSPRRKPLLQALFANSSRSYAEVARTTESRPERSDPLEREPCSSCEANSTNPSWDREPDDDDRCWSAPDGYGVPTTSVHPTRPEQPLGSRNVPGITNLPHRLYIAVAPVASDAALGRPIAPHHFVLKPGLSNLTSKM